MSPLALTQARLQRADALKAAQMAHLRTTAYRGVPTPDNLNYGVPGRRESKVAVYRGIPYTTK